MGKGRPTIKTAFLDSSVLFTAVNSPSGGSAKLFSVQNIKLVTSKLVLAEVERNIRKKLFSHHLERFFSLVQKLNIIESTPTKNHLTQAQKVIVDKDAVILATAKLVKPDFLLTLDKKHFLIDKVKKFISPVKIATPKIFFMGSEHV